MPVESGTRPTGAVTRKWSRHWRALVCAGVLAVIGAVLLGLWWRSERQRARVYEYSGIALGQGDVVVSEQDRFTYAFTDGDYCAILKLSDASLARVRASPPKWAQSGWQAGRAQSLAQRITIPDGNLISIWGREGSDVYRAITIDLRTRLVWFELIEY